MQRRRSGGHAHQTPSQDVSGTSPRSSAAIICAAACWLAANFYGLATTYYVDASRPDDTGSGTDWSAAKKTIQAAVNLTAAGDTVLVTNGVYNTGTTLTPGYALKNRVVITNAITVRSVSGPGGTIIEGSGTNWYNTSSAVRCVYMKRGTLDGFTLQNGATFGAGLGSSDYYERRGGGVSMYNSAAGTLVTNCEIRMCMAYWGGGSYYGSLKNCTLAGNLAIRYGGGSYYGTLDNCLITENMSDYGGGGSDSGTLNDCMLLSNTASSYGGGHSGGTLNNCTFSRNKAAYGGGVNAGTLNNCTVSGNTASSYGGGAYSSTLKNCSLGSNYANDGGGAYSCTIENGELVQNFSYRNGGGSYGGTLKNCTIWNNYATSGGGSYGGTLYNCVVWGNRVSNGIGNHVSSTFWYSCTVPLPSGVGNIDADPRFVNVGDLRLVEGSPCIDAGDSGYVTLPTDLAGNPRILNDVVDMGAYEGGVPETSKPCFHPPSGTMFSNSLQVVITCATEGAQIRYTMDGSTPIETDTLYVSPLTITGAVTLSASAFKPGMVSRSAVASYHPSYLFVDSSRPDDTGAGTSWASAKRTIQAAVDQALDGAVVLVADGVYSNGASITPGAALMSRVVITNAITVRSVNGPAVTVIEGSGTNWFKTASAIRCVYMKRGTLDGFTLRNGATFSYTGVGFLNGFGGGVCMYNAAEDTIVTNCVIRSCIAETGGGSSHGKLINCTLQENTSSSGGGGSYGGVLEICRLIGNTTKSNGGGSLSGTLNNCMIANNYASSKGGASVDGTLNSCTIIGNVSVAAGAGTYYGSLRNCIVWDNRLTDGSIGNYDSSTFLFCCTTPIPPGTGNIDADPLFQSNSDLCLQAGSPCINSGDNGYVTWGSDLAGTPRILNGIVDIGAYEYAYVDAPVPVPYAWMDQYPTLLSLAGANYKAAAIADADGDGHEAWQEYVAGTEPTNSESVLRALIAISNGVPRLAWSPDLGTARVYTVTGKTNVADTCWGPANAGCRFFRVGVSMP